ncbi:MAG: hypothetical protein WA510_11960 [Acidobacteriaceae bacterium]
MRFLTAAAAASAFSKIPFSNGRPIALCHLISEAYPPIHKAVIPSLWLFCFEGARLFQPRRQSEWKTGFTGCGKNAVFVSGPDFSRAVNDSEYVGL